MGTSTKHSRQPNLTRKKLREYSFNLERLYLPIELEDYLLDIYNEEDFHDDEGYVRNYTEEDIWYGVRKPIWEYAHIKKQMDDLLSASDYLGNRSLTIKVQNKKPSFHGWLSAKSKEIMDNDNDDDDDIPF